MNPFTKFLREVERMLCERVTLLFMAVTTAGALWFCLNSASETASDTFVLEPAKNSAVLGSLFFTLLTLAQFHRDYKNKTDNIILTCTDPIFYQLRRTLALICTAIVTTLIVTLFALPYALIKTGTYFQADAFAASWYLIFLGALALSILLSSGLYMLFRRAEAAFTVMAGLILLSKLLEYQEDLNPSYLLFWVQTNAAEFSDLVSNQFQIDMILWNRLFCTLTALGVWFLGLCSLRRYGHGVIGSFINNMRRIWVPLFLVSSIILSGISYAQEPIFDDSVLLESTIDYDSGTGLVVDSNKEQKNNTELLLFERHTEVDVDTGRRVVSGKATYTFQNLVGKEQILPVLINTGYTIKDVLVNGQPVDAVRYNTADKISATEENHATWYINLPADTESVVELSYCGSPKNKGIIVQEARNGICDEYVDLTSISVCPWAYTEISQDCRYSCTLTLDEHLTPVFIQGEPEKLDTVDGKTRWSYSQLSLGLNAAEYCTGIFEAGGITVAFKYFAKHDDEMANMDAVNVIKAAIDYFTEVYGPLTYEDHLIILELPAIYSGGYASGNMSATAETDFTGDIGTVVHEIAHQWWGLATYPVTDDTSCWSAEGITCYSTYHFMEYYFGAEYAEEHFINVWQNNWETYKNAFYIQNPKYLTKFSEDDASNVMNSLYNIGLYDIMPLQLLKAEETLGGVQAFQNKLSELYQAYLYNRITYEDFLSVIGLTKEVLNIE